MGSGPNAPASYAHRRRPLPDITMLRLQHLLLESGAHGCPEGLYECLAEGTVLSFSSCGWSPSRQAVAARGDVPPSLRPLWFADALLSVLRPGIALRHVALPVVWNS